MNETTVFIQPPEIGSSFAFQRMETNPFLFPLHKHDDQSEMLFILQGEGEFEIDGRPYHATPGSLLLYHRGVWHQERSTRYPFRALFISFRGMQLEGLPYNYFLEPAREPVLQLNEQMPTFKLMMQDIIAEHANTAPESKWIASHMLSILFARLARTVHYSRAAQSIRKISHAAIPFAKRYIEEHYHTAITLETLARLTYMNEYHFAHLFKQQVGVSPIQYLIRCRIDVAKRYLQTTDLLLEDIAERVGYRSETSFYALFKKMTGTTPRQYRDSSL